MDSEYLNGKPKTRKQPEWWVEELRQHGLSEKIWLTKGHNQLIEQVLGELRGSKTEIRLQPSDWDQDLIQEFSCQFPQKIATCRAREYEQYKVWLHKTLYHFAIDRMRKEEHLRAKNRPEIVSLGHVDPPSTSMLDVHNHLQTVANFFSQDPQDASGNRRLEDYSFCKTCHRVLGKWMALLADQLSEQPAPLDESVLELFRRFNMIETLLERLSKEEALINAELSRLQSSHNIEHAEHSMQELLKRIRTIQDRASYFRSIRKKTTKWPPPKTYFDCGVIRDGRGSEHPFTIVVRAPHNDRKVAVTDFDPAKFEPVLEQTILDLLVDDGRTLPHSSANDYLPAASAMASLLSKVIRIVLDKSQS